MLSVTTLVKPLTDRLWNAIFQWWDDVEGRKLCRGALTQIRNEKRNFEQLAAEPQYKSQAHEKAVTQNSFEITDKAMSRLLYLPRIRYWRIRRIAAEASRVCKQELSRPTNARESVEILTLINTLERRLERCTHGMTIEESACTF
jgi:hypothetical protein